MIIHIMAALFLDLTESSHRSSSHEFDHISHSLRISHFLHEHHMCKGDVLPPSTHCTTQQLPMGKSMKLTPLLRASESAYDCVPLFFWFETQGQLFLLT